MASVTNVWAGALAWIVLVIIFLCNASTCSKPLSRYEWTFDGVHHSLELGK